MKRILFASALAAAAAFSAAPAHAVQVGVSLGFAAPGAYGRVDIGRFRDPVLVSRSPVVVGARIVGREPVYLWVPREHRVRWTEYCGRYGACGVPVYFVEDGWYQQNVYRYVPSPVYAPAPVYAPSPYYGPAPYYAPRPVYVPRPVVYEYGYRPVVGGYWHDRDDWREWRDHDGRHDWHPNDGHPYKPYFPNPPGPPGSHGNGGGNAHGGNGNGNGGGNAHGGAGGNGGNGGANGHWRDHSNGGF